MASEGTVDYLSQADLMAGLDTIRLAPRDHGTLQMIVVRPQNNERVTLERCDLSARLGVHGDRWASVCWKTLPDGRSDPDVQVAITNSRCIDLVARGRDRWSLAGDNLFVDLDLSSDNLPCAQHLAIGSAILQVTAEPHNGCGKYAKRYGRDAAAFVNSALGRELHLRGIFARIVQDGTVAVGDRIRKV